MQQVHTPPRAARAELLYTRRGRRAGDRFGWSVAGEVDIDDDGSLDFIVGAPYSDAAARNAGKIFVYSGASGARLAGLNGENRGDKFGWSVAGLGRPGDFDGVIVGAPDNDETGRNAGKAYVYAGGDFSLLHAINGKAEGDRFGRSLASVGRVDDDQHDDFVVGSPWFDRGDLADAGRIDVYSGRTGSRLWRRWGERAGDRFGWAVAGGGDLDQDGHADVIASAPWWDKGDYLNAGKVRIHSGDDSSNLESYNASHPGDLFGRAVSGLGPLGGPVHYQIVASEAASDFGHQGAVRMPLVSPAFGGDAP